MDQGFADSLCKIIRQKHNHFFEILEFYLSYLFTLCLFALNDVVGNKRYYPTSAKHDGTTLNIRKTKKNVFKIFFKQREGKGNYT